MIVIKISTPFSDWPFLRQTPMENGTWKECSFFINDYNIEECDYWFIFEGLLKEETVHCPQENIFFLTGEPSSVKSYNNNFLKQFSTIITSNQDIKHKNLIFQQQSLPWHVGRKVKNEKNISFTKNYDDLKKITKFHKTKLISLVVSNKDITIGHKKRLEFVKQISRHFGSRLDVFGRGINPIEDKWDAIAPYKYHIVLENSIAPHYWTEKLSDTFLAGAYPFYYGDPDINEYFSESSLTKIDINNPGLAIEIIEKVINDNEYEKAKEQILIARNLILDKYNLFPSICDIVENNQMNTEIKQKILLKTELFFMTSYRNTFTTIKNKFKSMLSIFAYLVKIHILRDKFLIAHKKWVKDKGDETLRVNYNLTSDSIVFDLGGYQGDFAASISERYNCTIYIFEPVESFYNSIVERFKKNNKIKVFNFGLSDKNTEMEINVSADGSSTFTESEIKETILLKDIVNFLIEEKIMHIDLFKINIEGGEFEVMPALLNSSFINNITDIQIQFHTFIENAKNRRKKIREDLSKTHRLTYDYWFIWENWKLKIK